MYKHHFVQVEVICDAIQSIFSDQVRGEIDVIKACLPTQEEDEDSEESEEIEMSQDVDLEEILGKSIISKLKVIFEIYSVC